MDCYDAVVVRPFNLQMGGHSIIFLFDSDSICKNFDQNEFITYKNIPEPLRKFIPEYHGLALLRKMEPTDGAGQTMLVGVKIDDSYASDNYEDIFKLYDKFSKIPFKDLHIKQNDEYKIVFSEKILHTWDRIGDYKLFMLLENLTKDYKNPCILDIKMSNYENIPKDYHRMAKIMKASHKPRTPTSEEYGFRMCGIRYFDSSEGQFSFVDKYVGRNIDRDGFNQYLYRFLCPNPKISGLLSQLALKNLNELYNSLTSIGCFRLYYSSILLMYDYSEIDSPDSVKFQLKIIDFADSWFESFNAYKNSFNFIVEGPDIGYILSLEKLINCVKNTLHDHYQLIL